MDVRLPDGTVIQNVPDGTTKAQLAEKLMANGMDVPAEWMAPKQKPSVASMFKDELMTSLPGGVARGIKDVLDTGAGWISRLGGADESARIRAMNEQGKADFAAAQERTGNVVAPTVGRIGGNILATAPVTAFGGAAATAAGLPRLGSAIASGGMATGRAVAPGLAARAADLGIRSAGGAISGGVSAGLVDPESAGTGAVIGGALPPVVQGAGAAGRTLGSAVSGSAARTTAANKIAEALGDDAERAIREIREFSPSRTGGIPLSSAAITQNPQLAVLEQGSRVRGLPVWSDLDQRQAKAVFQNVMSATDEADAIAERALSRANNWQKAWKKAAESQKPELWQARMKEFANNIDRAAVAPQASNPAVRGVLDAIRGEIDRVGPNFTIGHLQQIRANLSGRANPISADAFKSAPRDSAAVKSIIKEIDDILNVSTGGKWENVIKGYAQDSAELHAAKAAEKVRSAFMDRETGRILGVAADVDTPKITEAGLGRAMNAARTPDKKLALSKNAMDQLDTTLDALRRQNILQRVKKTATAGGGSDTIPNQFAAAVARRTGTPNMLVQALDGIREIGSRKTDAQLAGLLANPDEMAAALSLLNRPRLTNSSTGLLYRTAPILPAGQ